MPVELPNLWTLDYIGKRRAGWSHLNLLDEALKVNGSSTLQVREQASLQRALYPTNPAVAPVAQGLRDFLGVRPLRYDDALGFLHVVRDQLALLVVQQPDFGRRDAVRGAVQQPCPELVLQRGTNKAKLLIVLSAVFFFACSMNKSKAAR